MARGTAADQLNMLTPKLRPGRNTNRADLRWHHPAAVLPGALALQGMVQAIAQHRPFVAASRARRFWPLADPAAALPLAVTRR